MADLFTNKYNGIELKVEDINVNDPDNWRITKEEAYVPNKDQFIYDSFVKDYPNLKDGITTYETDKTTNKVTKNIDIATSASKIYSLASRSSTLNIWLAALNIDYARSANIPQFYEKVITPTQYETLQNELRSCSEIEKQRAIKLNELAKQYKADVDKINDELNKEQQKIIDKTKMKNEFAIINLPTTKLPLTLQLAIENYTPSSTKNAPSRRAYAREVLVKYKLSLFEFLKNAQAKKVDVDIQKLIDDMSPK